MQNKSETIAATSETSQSRSPLSIRAFRDLWAANLLSNFGSQIQLVAAAWLMASMTGSAQMIALVQAAVSLPVMLFILLGGALADIVDRRLMMLVSQLFMLSVAALLTWLSWAGLVSPWLLLLFTFLIFTGESVNNPAWHASVRDIVPRASISRAVGLNSVSINLARTLGPALGGAIVAFLGAPIAFLVNSASYLALIAALLRWRPTPRVVDIPREQLLPAMATGIRYAARAAPMRAVMLRGGISGFSASAAFALMPVVAQQKLGGGPLLLGILLGAFGTGAVVGAAASGRMRDTLSAETTVRAAMVALTAGLLLLGATSFMLLSAIGAALCGAGWVLGHSSFNATVQLAAPRWVSGRALALYQTAVFAAIAGGSWMFGLIAERAGVSSAFFAASALQILGGSMALRLRLPDTNTLNLEPLARWDPPQLDLEIDDRSGPVVVQIEYRIAETDIAEFRSVMAERARIRRRDGALDWALWRDLHDRLLWVERYRVRDWAECVRHNMRRTHDDVSNLDALLRLHAGPGRPLIRRHLRSEAS